MLKELYHIFYSDITVSENFPIWLILLKEESATDVQDEVSVYSLLKGSFKRTF